MARRPLAFEQEYPWEAERGSALERTLDVHTEAQRVYAQQKALLPALQLERAPDPEGAARVRDVGRRTRILREHETLGRHGWRPGDSPQKNKTGSPTKRVVPSRFPEEEYVGDTGDDGGGASDLLDGRIVRSIAFSVGQKRWIVGLIPARAVCAGVQETMLMDQEWDTQG